MATAPDIMMCVWEICLATLGSKPLEPESLVAAPDIMIVGARCDSPSTRCVFLSLGLSSPESQGTCLSAPCAFSSRGVPPVLKQLYMQNKHGIHFSKQGSGQQPSAKIARPLAKTHWVSWSWKPAGDIKVCVSMGKPVHGMASVPSLARTGPGVAFRKKGWDGWDSPKLSHSYKWAFGSGGGQACTGNGDTCRAKCVQRREHN